MCVDFLYDFRYNVAVTKVFKKHMHSIVVDTEQTAQECILYLRNHMLDRETFLPLNYIKYIPLKERLRNIQDPPNVKLLYDILSYPPEIEKAILLVTNNILVCDTMDQARWVAWVMEDRQNYDVVALVVLTSRRKVSSLVAQPVLRRKPGYGISLPSRLERRN